MSIHTYNHPQLYCPIIAWKQYSLHYDYDYYFMYSALRLSAQAADCPETMHTNGISRYHKCTKRVIRSHHIHLILQKKWITRVSDAALSQKNLYSFDRNTWSGSSLETASGSASFVTVSVVPLVNNADLLASSLGGTSGRDMKMVPGLTAAFCVRDVMYWNTVPEDQLAGLSALHISNTQHCGQTAVATALNIIC